MGDLAILTESTLLSVTKALLAGIDLSGGEAAVLADVPDADSALVQSIRRSILGGGDPLGEAFAIIRPAADRRGRGQTFTPPEIVEDMVSRAVTDAAVNSAFVRVVDPGLGSGRYLRRAAIAFPHADLIGIELDPVCALLARATFHVLGLSDRLQLIVGDFRGVNIPQASGRSLYLGNPPYVRHHALGDEWKSWYATTAIGLGAASASKLAGLHLHFFVRIAQVAAKGDLCILITAAEWLDTGYGRTLRSLLLGDMGGRSVLTIDAKAEPFPGTLATAAITTFSPGKPPKVVAFARAGSVTELASAGFVEVAHADLAGERWSAVGQVSSPALVRATPAGRIGDLFRVSRGQVTGNNAAFITSSDVPSLPSRFLTSCVTGADELFEAADRHEYRLTSAIRLRKVVSLPCDLSGLTGDDHGKVKAYLKWAERLGAKDSYTARQRKCWWHVPLHAAAPIIVTYMARRSAAFVRNDVGARLLNIAHSVRPLVPVTAAQLDAACRAMNEAAATFAGRTYAGGLVKYEPRDVESIPIDWGMIGLSGLNGQLFAAAE